MGTSVPGGIAAYMGSVWMTIGNTDGNGQVLKELLPVSYTFKMDFSGTTRFKTQDLSTGSNVEFVV